MMKKFLVLAIGVSAISCNESNEVVAPNVTIISLSVQNLPPLDEGHYQLWGTFYNFNKPDGSDVPAHAAHDGEFENFGAFNVTSGGSIRGVNGGSARFSLPAGSDPQLLKDIVIAVQANHHDRISKSRSNDPGSIIMGGAFFGDAGRAIADLHIAYADAFKSSFASVSGRCSIVCPTSPADSNSGVWFLELGSPPTAGLRNLPRLPPQWRYEGWVLRPDIIAGGFTHWSTGKFARADSADLDGAGANSGMGTPFNFPGQDFVRGSTVFSNLLTGGYSFMVTIEPFPDNSAKPFFLTLLSTLRMPPPGSGRMFLMENVMSQSAPTARIVIRR